MTPDEMRAHWSNRVGRLEALHVLANDENRELTDAEHEQVSILRSEIRQLETDIKTAELPKRPTNEELAESVRRSAPQAQLVYGGRDLTRLASSDDDHTTILR